jgi:hypothetical protein
MTQQYVDSVGGNIQLEPSPGRDVKIILSEGGKLNLSGGGFLPSVQLITGDGAITVPDNGESYVILSKGSAAAITIPVPTAAQNGTRIHVMTTSAYAHVITQSTVGFNAKGSSGTATAATTFIGELVLYAYAGNWYTFGRYLWTIA